MFNEEQNGIRNPAEDGRDELLFLVGQRESTWSAVQRARANTGTDPVPAVSNLLRAAWGPEKQARRVEWPLTLRIGRA